LRWRSSILRDLFYTLRSLPRHVFTLHPNAIFTMILTPLGAIIALLVMVAMLTSDPWPGPAPCRWPPILAWAPFQLGHRQVQPPRSHSSSPAFGAYIAWRSPVRSSLQPLALCTFDSGDWGTRAKVSQEGRLGHHSK